jgi:glycosyltransferase involved in cell wall biosynthesis
LNKKKIPIFSIVIPTYNHAIFLKRALKSIIDQSFKNWEAIIIDNYSTDSTQEVVMDFNDPRIKYLKVHNKGIIAISRNIGIQNAKADWIAFLDSDDWWTSNKLEVCFNKLNENIDFIYHRMKIKSDKFKLISRKKTKNKQLTKPILTNLLVGGNVISNSSVVVRKNLLDKIGYLDEREELVAVEDYHTWLRIAKLTDKFLYLSKCLGYYLSHDQSVSQKNMSIPSRMAVHDFKEILTKQQNLKLEANIKYKSGRFYYLNNNFDKSKKDLIYVLKYGYYSLKLRSLLMLFIILFK